LPVPGPMCTRPLNAAVYWSSPTVKIDLPFSSTIVNGAWNFAAIFGEELSFLASSLSSAATRVLSAWSCFISSASSSCPPVPGTFPATVSFFVGVCAPSADTTPDESTAAVTHAAIT